ncbi:hypothetical protein TNCT_148941 [Trichonephila clavata]|uniref:Uncharacterized protein n=1 Tax=Trichonephila clavata TaxID=2740835 RepID=A0A8X6L8U5_TRICU|nr:hypothetical protein TNCT_148941 [Trichonephila clavata]
MKLRIVFDASAHERTVLEKERCKIIHEQKQFLNEEQETSDDDTELPQATEKVPHFKSEHAKILSVDPDAVAQPVAVEEEKRLSRDSHLMYRQFLLMMRCMKKEKKHQSM